MSRQNKMVALRFYDVVLGEKDVAVLDQLCSVDIVDHNPLPGQPAGLQGMKRVMADYFHAFPDLIVTVEGMIAEDDLVAARFTARGTHRGPFLGLPATGKKVNFHGIDMFRIKGGKAVEVWHEGNDVAVMMELGVSLPA
jgi:steroid delta-isomerase-like uncharacterized protein